MNKLNRVVAGTVAGWLVCACGGTVDLQGGTGGGAGNGSGGSTVDVSSGGSTGSTGSTGSGGGGVGGTGSVGSGGSADQSSAGGAATEAPTIEEACSHYCDAYVSVCPEAGHGTVTECAAACVDGLSNASASCISGKLEAFECIAAALLEVPGVCVDALEHAAGECGSADANVPACNEQCLPQIHGESGVAYAEAVCGGHTVSLRCEDTVGDGTPCACRIDDVQVFSLATGFSGSKAAVSDEQLFQLCLSKL